MRKSECFKRLLSFRARTAEAARWMLTKEKFGYQQSIKYLNDNFDYDNEMNIFSSLSHIGSDDSVFPKSLWYTLRTKYNGHRSDKVNDTYLILLEFPSLYE